jgi:branched-chain amino acid aminotransferase
MNTPYAGWSEKQFHAIHQDGEWKITDTGPVITASATSVQYGQSVIEGMKAYRNEEGEITLFRVKEHWERLQRSIRHLNLPPIEFDFFQGALLEVVTPITQWTSPIQSQVLYIRPIVYGLGGEIFPMPGTASGFSIYTAPVGNFAKERCSIQFYDVLTRSSENGINHAKTALNYAPIVAKPFRNKQYTDVWFNPMTGYIEEADTANIFFVLNNSLIVTPPVNNRILPGITRNSVIKIIREETTYQLQERNMTVQEVVANCARGELTDCFMTSTGIGIQHVNHMLFKQREYLIAEKNQVANVLKEKYRQAVSGELGKFSDWRTVAQITGEVRETSLANI